MTDRIGDASGEVSLPRRPLLVYWLIAVAIEFVLAAVFVLTGADAAIETALEKAGLDFATDFITAARALIAYPAATVGVVLSLLQVAAPDLAVVGVSVIRGGPALRRAVTGRLRFWSREVGTRRGLTIWGAMILTFTACNLVSGLLHQRFVGGGFRMGARLGDTGAPSGRDVPRCGRGARRERLAGVLHAGRPEAVGPVGRVAGGGPRVGCVALPGEVRRLSGLRRGRRVRRPRGLHPEARPSPS